MNKLPIEKLLQDHVLTIGKREYQLRKVSKEELLLLRIKNKPGVVFLCESEIWYSDLPSIKVKISGQKWLEHCCSQEKDCCCHLSALPDSEGGCRAIRDTNAQYYISRGFSKREAYIRSFRIEKYNFLKCALETFGTEENGFKALKCKNMLYEKSKLVDSAINVDVEQKISDLAQYLDLDLNKISKFDDEF